MKAKIRIESIHGDDDPIIVCHDAVRIIADEEERIRYGDGDMIVIRPDEIVIEENAQMKAHIVLRADDEVRETPFETEMGTLLFGIRTHHLRVIKIPGKTVIEAEYSLLADGEQVSQVKMFITVADCG